MAFGANGLATARQRLWQQEGYFLNKSSAFAALWE